MLIVEVVVCYAVKLYCVIVGGVPIILTTHIGEKAFQTDRMRNKHQLAWSTELRQA